MKKIFIVFLLVFGMGALAKAQDYNTGIGIRAGFNQGLTVKHFISQSSALEFLVATRWKGFEITGLYEVHARAFNTVRLKWFFGLGGHIGFWNGDNVRWGDPEVQYTVLGIDGILGLEYSFIDVPFNVSIDWKPSYNLWGYKGFWADGGALSIRYIF